MRTIGYILSYSILFFLLTSCSGKPYQALFEQKEGYKDTATVKNTPEQATYHIKPQDQLQIRNLQNIKYVVDEAPSATAGSSGAGTAGNGQTYQVEEDGSVALPVIGHVTVVGLTRVQAERQVEDLYRKKLLKDPIIELKITNLKVTLLGEVKGQGNFPLIKDRTTLVEMIGQAGGLTTAADETHVKIIRGSDLNPEVTIINLRDIHSINDPRALLQNGDIIYFGQNKRAVRNENLQNVSTLAQPILLLLNTALLIISFSRH